MTTSSRFRHAYPFVTYTRHARSHMRLHGQVVLLTLLPRTGPRRSDRSPFGGPTFCSPKHPAELEVRPSDVHKRILCGPSTRGCPYSQLSLEALPCRTVHDTTRSCIHKRYASSVRSCNMASQKLPRTHAMTTCQEVVTQIRKPLHLWRPRSRWHSLAKSMASKTKARLE